MGSLLVSRRGIEADRLDCDSLHEIVESKFREEINYRKKELSSEE